MVFTYPLVSVIVPVFNGGNFLAESIGSIRAQNYDPLEIIIVDDGSTDGSALITSTLGKDIHYIYQSNKGVASARNTGLNNSSGVVIAFLDQDDVWPMNKLSSQVPFLMEQPEIDIVMGKTRLFGELSRLKYQDRFERLNYVVDHSFLGSGVIRKSVFEIIGFFDTTLKTGDDIDWMLRARDKAIPIIKLEHVTLQYRIHQGNLMRETSLIDLQFTQIIKKSLDRRRTDNREQKRTVYGE